MCRRMGLLMLLSKAADGHLNAERRLQLVRPHHTPQPILRLPGLPLFACLKSLTVSRPLYKAQFFSPTPMVV
jgi:hypothetical protein